MRALLQLTAVCAKTKMFAAVDCHASISERAAPAASVVHPNARDAADLPAAPSAYARPPSRHRHLSSTSSWCPPSASSQRCRPDRRCLGMLLTRAPSSPGSAPQGCPYAQTCSGRSPSRQDFPRSAPALRRRSEPACLLHAAAFARLQRLRPPSPAPRFSRSPRPPLP